MSSIIETPLRCPLYRSTAYERVAVQRSQGGLFQREFFACCGYPVLLRSCLASYGASIYHRE